MGIRRYIVGVPCRDDLSTHPFRSRKQLGDPETVSVRAEFHHGVPRDLDGHHDRRTLLQDPHRNKLPGPSINAAPVHLLRRGGLYCC